MKYLLSAILIWGVSTSCKLEAKSVAKPVKTTLKAKNGGVPHEINYQGWLGDTSDTNGITDALDMKFRLYADSTGGTAIWAEIQNNVPVDKGIFNVLLGSQTSIPSDKFTGDPLWLETQVVNDTLSPRKKLVSVGYAIKSEEAEHAIYSDTADYAPAVPDSDWTLSGSNLYAQNTSWNVLIGTTSSSTDARLHVDANNALYGVYGKGSAGKVTGVYGFANGADCGVLGQGSTDKMAGVYGVADGANYGVQGRGSNGKIAGVFGLANNADYGVYGRGSTGKTAGVYGSANGADYAGYFDGDVHIKGKVIIDTVVRYYSIPSCEFGRGVNGSGNWSRGNDLFTNIGVSSDWYAGVNLPDSAIVTSIDGYVRDTDASKDITLRLYRGTHFTGGFIMASASSSGSSGKQTITGNTIDNATIDNENYAYYVKVTLRVDGGIHGLYQVRIKYEITQPLP